MIEFGPEIVINIYSIAVHDILFCMGHCTNHPFLPVESNLGFLGVGFYLLGVCLPHHRCPPASHPVTRTIVILIVSLSYLQNRDMGQKRLRVAHCRWCMVGWDRIAHPEYISSLQLFATSSHVSCRRFLRIDNGERLAEFSPQTDTHTHFQARWDVQPHHRCLYNSTYTQGPR